MNGVGAFILTYNRKDLLAQCLAAALGQSEPPDEVVVLDLKTPGGAIDATFQMMEALEQFPGQTIAYVDDEAVSAGAWGRGTAVVTGRGAGAGITGVRLATVPRLGRWTPFEEPPFEGPPVTFSISCC